MKKLLGIVVLGLLWCNTVVADKLPDELKSDLLGTGKKKLDVNYLCINTEDKKDKIKYSYTKYKTQKENILLRLDYRDDYNNVFFSPIRPLIKYDNFKDQTNFEVYLDYVLWGEFEGEYIVNRNVFIPHKNRNGKYTLWNLQFTITPSEFAEFSDLYELQGLLDFELALKNFSNTKNIKKYINDLVKRNNDFHKLIIKDINEPKSISLKSLVYPDIRSRVTKIDKILTGVTVFGYECKKK